MTLIMNAVIYWTQALSFMSQLQGMPLWFKALHKTWNFISDLSPGRLYISTYGKPYFWIGDIVYLCVYILTLILLIFLLS